MPLLERAAAHIANDFYGGSWDDPVAASNSACYESSRSAFGQVGHLMERVFGDSCVVCPGINFCGFGPQIRVGSMPQHVPASEQEKRRTGGKDPWPEGFAFDYDLYERRLDYVSREEEPCVKKTVFYDEVTVDGVRYCNSWFETFFFPAAESFWMNEIMIDALRACDRDEALAKVACVLEPFKIRIITKGEAALQYVSTFFQKSAFQFNATVPCFRLVGKAPSTLDLIDLRENAERAGISDRQWASSDFSGASDGTAGHFRDTILDCLIMHLPLHIQSLLRSCNGDHIVSYPGPSQYPSMEKHGVVGTVKQTLGTLMGEKTSFIILCYEVLAAHVSNRRRCGDKRPLDDILQGVLINGDDRLAVSNQTTEHEFWTYCSTYLGFSESVGKSYLHPQYANINSQSYVFDLTKPDTPFRVPVRCSGLEHGQKKLDEPFDPTCVITQILDGCIDSKMEWAVAQRFFRRFAGELTRVAAGRNLFVHPSLGGLGNRAPLRHPHRPCRIDCHHRYGCEWKVEVTEEQTYVASALLNEPSQRFDVYGPCGPVEVDLPQLVETPWDVFGKPSYWNQEEFELKEMMDYFRSSVSQLKKSESPLGLGQFREVLSSRGHVVLKLLHKSDLLLGRRRSALSQPAHEPRRAVIEYRCWKCQCCGEMNRVAEPTCGVCLLARTELREMFGPDMVFHLRNEEIVDHSRLIVRKNVSLGRLRMGRLGYSLPTLDEFDLALYDHAIECARKEEFGAPMVRFCGRAVDLFGDEVLWPPLRPVQLVW